MILRSSRLVLALAALAIVAGAPRDAEARKKPERVITATIDGKKFKPTKRTVYLSVGGGTIGFLASAQKIKIRGTTRTLQVSCAVLFTNRTYPFSSTDCLTSYGETKGTSLKIWTDIPTAATTVTFDSFDGTNIAGSFESVVPSLTNPELPAKTVVGTFRGRAEQADPNR